MLVHGRLPVGPMSIVYFRMARCMYENTFDSHAAARLPRSSPRYLSTLTSRRPFSVHDTVSMREQEKTSVEFTDRNRTDAKS